MKRKSKQSNTANRATRHGQAQEGSTPQVARTLPAAIASRSLLHHRLIAPALGLSLLAYTPAYGQGPRAEDSPRFPRAMSRAQAPRGPVANNHPHSPSAADLALPGEIAPIDGYGNNLANKLQGTAEHPFIRLAPVAYGDGVSEPAGGNRASARAISNAVCAQSEDLPNKLGATDYLWQWGQFVDHDLVETPTLDPAEPFNIPIPSDDLWFPPGSEMPLERSFYEASSSPREQVNFITAYLDGSQVYGSTEERAYALRALDGSGRMKVRTTNNGELLPYNFTGLENAPAPSPSFFLAGDVRANEQVALTAMHTLFVREHNYWAAQYLNENPDSVGEQAYQFARMMVTAELQAITYREFLPVLLGPDALSPYRGYDPTVDASIANEFGAAAYRLGHSMLSPSLLRINRDGSEAPEGHLPLAAAFFDPTQIEENGIDSILRGLASQNCQELDEKVVDGVRNLLFGPPGSGGFDLASLNIQRGRDHGLPDYNTMRVVAGLRPARRLADINPATVAELSQVYSSPNEVDLWVGCLCERKAPDAMVGPLLQRILADQFRRLRDGDRFYYQHHLPAEMVRQVEAQTLATIIRRNTGIAEELQDNVFLSAATPTNRSPNRRPHTSDDRNSRRR